MYSNIVFAPGYDTNNYPGGFESLSTEQKLDAFYARYKIWYFDFANLILGNPDFGYALLSLLNPYFEMYACRRVGINPYTNTKYNNRKKWISGCQDVYSIDKKYAESLYKNMRCKLAHEGFIGAGIGLSEDYEDAITIFPNDTISINPRSWYLNITHHFEHYINSMKNNTSGEMCQNFLASFE